MAVIATGMREYMLSRGWNYTGQCNCTPRMDIYRNASLQPRYEVRINATQFQIKDITYPIPRTVTSGAIGSFEDTYQRFFNPQP